MKIDVLNKCPDFNTYRAARVKSLFNPERGDAVPIRADIDIDGDDWQIGLIVGPSGSGKTTIGNAVFGGGRVVDLYGGWDNGLPIVEAIAPAADFNAVTGALASVGLGDVPAWLRPFKALSNGQQFRAGLARLTVDAPTDVVVDEFTSVVDRQIAKIGAMAFAKAWRKNKGKRIILLTPHYDILEWLQPDWAYDTATGETKKKLKSGPDQASSWKLGRSTVVTGDILNRITI